MRRPTRTGFTCSRTFWTQSSAATVEKATATSAPGSPWWRAATTSAESDSGSVSGVSQATTWARPEAGPLPSSKKVSESRTSTPRAAARIARPHAASARGSGTSRMT